MLRSLYEELEEDVSSNLSLFFLVIPSCFIDFIILGVLVTLAVEGFFL